MILLRVAKSEAAYLYQLLEAREGLANYSTYSKDKDLAYRDILLHPAPDMLATLEEQLLYIAQEIPFERLEAPADAHLHIP